MAKSLIPFDAGSLLAATDLVEERGLDGAAEWFRFLVNREQERRAKFRVLGPSPLRHGRTPELARRIQAWYFDPAPKLAGLVVTVAPLAGFSGEFVEIRLEARHAGVDFGASSGGVALGLGPGFGSRTLWRVLDETHSRLVDVMRRGPDDRSVWVADDARFSRFEERPRPHDDPNDFWWAAPGDPLPRFEERPDGE